MRIENGPSVATASPRVTRNTPRLASPIVMSLDVFRTAMAAITNGRRR